MSGCGPGCSCGTTLFANTRQGWESAYRRLRRISAPIEYDQLPDFTITPPDPYTELDVNLGKHVWEMSPTELARRPTDWDYPADSMTPWQGPIPHPGSWRLNPCTATLERCVEVPVRGLMVSEPTDGIAERPEFPLYVEWRKRGLLAPPIVAVRNYQGHWLSANRRRLMAARAAGASTILAWLADTDLATGFPTHRLADVLARRRS